MWKNRLITFKRSVYNQWFMENYNSKSEKAINAETIVELRSSLILTFVWEGFWITEKHEAVGTFDFCDFAGASIKGTKCGWRWESVNTWKES